MNKKIEETTNNSQEDVMKVLEDENYINSLIEKYDLSGSTKPVSTSSSGEITLNTRNAGEGPEITLSKAEIDEINVQPTAAAKMAKALLGEVRVFTSRNYATIGFDSTILSLYA